MEQIQQEYFTINELAKMFNKDRATIWRWGKAGKFPEPTRKFGNPLWHKSDIENFKGAA